MKQINAIIIIALAIFFNTESVAQERLFRNDTIKVSANGNYLKMPWGGGLNGGTISEIDCNFDGIKDLFIFEANNRYDPLTGDRFAIFLKLQDSTTGKFYYKYAPEYKSAFPKMEYFALLRDFNGDGKEDIFTRNEIDQIEVYRNDSDTSLKFTLYIPKIQSSAPASLPPTYPFFKDIFQDFINASSFEDIDGDGDIDMLILDRSENYIEYHKNISPTRDTMIFELRNTIWGNAVVNRDTIVLNQTHPQGNIANPERKKLPKNYYNVDGGGKGNKDAGVGLLAIDLNGDGVKDLISATPFSLRAAINNGTVTSSNFSSVNFNYPPSKPVKNVSLFATPSYVDVDFDGKKDLISSVMWDEFEDDSSFYFYKNTGTNASPVFSHRSDNFFQSEMLDLGTRSYPKFFDYNGDSLMDIIIGNEGYFEEYQYPNPTVYSSRLAVYVNVGERWEPEYELVTEDFLGLSSVNLDIAANKPAVALNPTFGDLDGDGDDDMIIGDKNGYLHYFENTAGPGNIMTFIPPVINYQGIQVGLNNFLPGNGYASPQLIDLNRDGLLDLIIGDRGGHMHYYKNTGTASSPTFTLESDSLGMINVSEDWDFYDGGYNKPFIFTEKVSGEYHLIAGSKNGYLYYYDDLENNGTLNTVFPVADSSYQDIWIGPYSSVHGADINGDTTVDFIVGNQAGGVVIYTSTGIGYPIGLKEQSENQLKVQVFPNPATTSIRVNIWGIEPGAQLSLRLIDILGKTHRTTRITNDSDLDISGLSEGIYFLQIELDSGEQLSTEKLIIRR